MLQTELQISKFSWDVNIEKVGSYTDQGFETWSGPYGPTELTKNRYLKRFFNHKKPEIIFLLWTSRIAVKRHGFLNRTRVFRFPPQKISSWRAISGWPNMFFREEQVRQE